jgi:hypothetical protein
MEIWRSGDVQVCRGAGVKKWRKEQARGERQEILQDTSDVCMRMGLHIRGYPQTESNGARNKVIETFAT